MMEDNDRDPNESLAQHAGKFSSEVSDDDLQLLKDEMEILGEDDHRQTAERLFLENLPMAVLSIVRLSQTAGSDRTRLDASKYIVERNLGRLQDINAQADDPLRKLVEELREDTDGATPKEKLDAN